MAHRQITLDIPDDLDVLDNGIHFVDGKDEVDYLWYYIREREAGQVYEGFRVVRLVQLDYLAMETRMDPELLKKMWQVLWGQHRVSAPVDFLHVVAGIFKPTPIGIVQMYGVCALGATLDEAVTASRLGLEPLLANLRSSYRQVRLKPLDSALGEWITTGLARFRYVTSIIGHPDPREVGPSAGSKQGPAQAMNGPAGSLAGFSEQQNERFFRAMAAGAGHEFLWLLLAHPLPGEQVGQMLEGLADDASSWLSRAQGSKGIGLSLSLPILLSQSAGQSVNAGYGANAGHSHASGLGTAYSQGQAVGYGEAVGGSHSVGVSEARGVGHNWGISQSESWGESSAVGQSAAVSHGVGLGQSLSTGHAVSTAVTDSVSHSVGESWGHSSGGSETTSSTVSVGLHLGAGHSAGSSDNVSQDGNQSTTWPASTASGQIPGVGGSAPVTPGKTDGSGWGTGQSTNTSDSANGGASVAISRSQVSSGFSSNSHGLSVSDSWGRAVSQGTSDSIGRGWSSAESWGASDGVAISRSVSHGVAVGRSEGWSESASQGVSEGWSSNWSQSRSVSDSQSQGVSRQTSEGDSTGQGWTQALGLARSLGVSGGVVPGLSANKTYQWVNDSALQVGELLRRCERLLRDGLMSGLWMTDVYTLTDEPESMAVIEAAARSAFGGLEDVVTAVQARTGLSPEEQLYLRLHAASFTPATMRERVQGLEAYRHSQTLNPLMLATYASPSSMELGSALTVAEMIPDFAFRPNMGKNEPGQKAILGFQYSTETGDLLDTPVVLSEPRHTHTIFQGDTGSGKSEAAYRLALECWKWGHRVLVLDFAKGWDRFFHSEIPRRHFDLYQLWPDSPRPLRWAVLSVPELIHPETYVTMVCTILVNAGRLGPVQKGIVQGALQRLYIQQGVLLRSPEVLDHARWGQVSAEEAARLALPSGQPVASLTRPQAQALAVYRSRQVSLLHLVGALHADATNRPPTDRIRQSLESLLTRLDPLVFGEVGQMFGSLADQEDAVPIDRLGLPAGEGERPGFVVVQGGDRLDEFARSFLLGLLACVNYESGKIRFDKADSSIPFYTDVVWEEAQKVLCGVSDGAQASQGTGSQSQTIEEFARMWRDGRRYGMFQWPIVQNLSQLPAGIVPSCNNGYFFRTKDMEDQKIVMTYINRSPQGFVDQRYQRLWARLPTGCCVFKAGNAMDIAEMEPVLMRPLLVPMNAPTEAELQAYYASLAIVRRWQAL